MAPNWKGCFIWVGCLIKKSPAFLIQKKQVRDLSPTPRPKEEGGGERSSRTDPCKKQQNGPTVYDAKRGSRKLRSGWRSGSYKSKKEDESPTLNKFSLPKVYRPLGFFAIPRPLGLCKCSWFKNRLLESFFVLYRLKLCNFTWNFWVRFNRKE